MCERVSKSYKKTRKAFFVAVIRGKNVEVDGFA